MWIRISLILIVAAFLFGNNYSLHGQSLQTKTVAKNLDTPWEILWGPDGYIWITERFGRVSKVHPDSGRVIPLITIAEVHEQGESGLLGMTLHPDFPSTPEVFLAYNYLDGANIKERIVKYTYQPDTLLQPKILLDDIPGNSNHNGCRMVITPDRKLLLSTGDARNPQSAQDNNSLSGKFLRLNLDGSIPQDNPIPNNYMFSKGHRNPQGLVIAPDGTIYSSEHGPQTDDELNIIKQNRNYGWPTVKGFCDSPSEQTFCNNNQVVEPLVAWTPTLAVSAIDFYDNTKISNWQNSILMVSLKEDDLRQMPLNAAGDSVLAENIFFDNQFGRLRDLAVSPAGDVYLATSNRDGRANDGFPLPEDDRIIQVTDTTVTSTQPISNQPPVEIYPNPASTSVRVHFPKTAEALSLQWMDLQGRIVKTRDLSNPRQVTFHKNSFRNGMYFLIIRGQDWQVARKVVWQ